MKTAWTILAVSAFTDFIISFGTALSAAMLAADKAQIPDWPALIIALIGGAVASARTIQQALKASVETKAAITNTPAPRVIE